MILYIANIHVYLKNTFQSLVVQILTPSSLLIISSRHKPMVGFGSSLRMSRRRGWEDAYLDYASLRLLLTQIEAVYEEEDWKRGGTVANDDEPLDEEWGRWPRGSADETEEGAMNGVWRLFSRRHRRKRRMMRRRRMRAGWDAEGEESESNWVVTANVANSRSSPRRDKKDKASHALDKRGWRSPGVTDYRDELFLVSYSGLRHDVMVLLFILVWLMPNHF